MEYQEILQRVKALDFIKDQDTADAAVKAVLGILASSLDEHQALRLAEKLPPPLDIERLSSHRARVENITIDQYIAEIRTEFNLNKEQALTLVNTVFHALREAIGDEVFFELEDAVPEDWAEVMQRA